MIEVGVWDLKGEKGKSNGDGQTNVCWAMKRMRTENSEFPPLHLADTL